MEPNKGNTSFKDACEQYPSFRRAVQFAKAIIDITTRCPKIISQLFPSYEKNAHQFMEYQRSEPMVMRSHDQDRVHPLETVTLQQFNREHETNIEHAIVHSGPLADEFARSLNALAVTVGTDIYFRNNAWNPTDEEGRKLLAHELTHVEQFTDGRISPHTSVKTLEAEAEDAEVQEGYECDPFVDVETGGQKFRVRQSKLKEVSREVARDVEDWVERQKDYLSTQDYFELLNAYRSWMREAR